MYIYAIENRDALHEIIEHELKSLGIKLQSKIKKSITIKRSIYDKTRIFKRPLEQLPCQSVHLNCGAVIQVPCFLVDLCETLKLRLETEGIFRKAGSAVRQREIRAHIEAGGPLLKDFHEIDTANILKLFLRELPEPILPWHFHETFVKCYKRSTDQLLMACMLLPHQNFNTLAYLMQFLHQVAKVSNINLMPASNLAIVLVPAIMPVQESVSKHMDHNHALQHDQHVHVVQVLIEKAEHLGKVPANLTLQLGLQTPEDEAIYDEVDRASFGSLESLGPGAERRARKRRSGSLTRVLNGLRKIVGGGRSGPSPSPEINLDTQTSPLIMSAKKRKIDSTAGGISSKKKLEVLQCLPEGFLLSGTTPVRPCMQPLHYLSDCPAHCYNTPPVCSDPNPQKSVIKSPQPQVLKSKPKSRFFTPKSRSESLLQRAVGHSDKKQRLSFGSKKISKKQQKPLPLEVPKESVRQPPKRKKSWSSLGGSWGRSMRRLAPVSSTGTPLLCSPYATRFKSCSEESPVALTDGVDLSPVASPTVNYNNEYEEIKNKVNNLENQLNEEINKAQKVRVENTDGHTACFVQCEYERTLEDSEPFSNCQTTEQLAKRLSKELKIRRSGENKVIRSPSARKIGSLRRRSRELSRPLLKTSSLGKIMRSPVRSTIPLPNARCLRRGRPNTVFSGLPSPATNLQKLVFSSTQSLTTDAKSSGPSPPAIQPVEFLVPQSPFVGVVTRSVQKASSFNSKRGSISLNTEIKKALSFGNVADSEGSGDIKWRNGDSFFNSATPGKNLSMIGRPSIAEIKRNRAGMVLASVKLFDNTHSSNNTQSFKLNDIEKPGALTESKQLFGDSTCDTHSPTRKKIVTPTKPHLTEVKSPLKSSTRSKQFTPLSDGAKQTHIKSRHYSVGNTKTNNSLPRNWLREKENIPSFASPFCIHNLKTQYSPQMKLPQGLKETIYDVCTPTSQRLKSPLALQDINRIAVAPIFTTPQQCPVIKKPLSVRPILASTMRRTPHKVETPRGMRPLQATPLRRSPRLLALALNNPSFS